MGWLCLRCRRDHQRSKVDGFQRSAISSQIREVVGQTFASATHSTDYRLLFRDSQHYEKFEVLGTAPSVHGTHFCHLVYGATAASNAGIRVADD